jgi:hypothetical protein
VIIGLKTANIALRFLLELCVWAALGYWGFRTGNGIILRFSLGIVVPFIVAVVWGIFGAPKSSMVLVGGLHLLLELVLFGSATLALWVSGNASISLSFGLIAIINRVLMYVWGQRLRSNLCCTSFIQV